MKRSTMVLGFTFSLLAGCGGGGGGGGAPFYAGIWDFTGTKQIDDCNLGLESTTQATFTVNQDEERVVANVRDLTLTGSVDRERDGFNVSGPGPAIRGCSTAAAISFRDASDGEAGVGYAIAARCGIVQCTVGYGGIAFRHGRRSALTEVMNLDEAFETLVAGCQSGTYPRSSVAGRDIEEEALFLAEALVR